MRVQKGFKYGFERCDGRVQAEFVSPSGRVSELTLPMGMDDFKERFRAWQGGSTIQSVFPELSNAERELFVTGYSSQEWDEVFA